MDQETGKHEEREEVKNSTVYMGPRLAPLANILEQTDEQVTSKAVNGGEGFGICNNNRNDTIAADTRVTGQCFCRHFLTEISHIFLLSSQRKFFSDLCFFFFFEVFFCVPGLI